MKKNDRSSWDTEEVHRRAAWWLMAALVGFTSVALVYGATSHKRSDHELQRNLAATAEVAFSK